MATEEVTPRECRVPGAREEYPHYTEKKKPQSRIQLGLEGKASFLRRKTTLRPDAYSKKRQNRGGTHPLSWTKRGGGRTRIRGSSETLSVGFSGPVLNRPLESERGDLPVGGISEREASRGEHTKRGRGRRGGEHN